MLTLTSAGARTEYWGQKSSLFDLMPVKSGDTVFLGNSITDGMEWSEYFQDLTFKNRGISGDVIDGVEERLDNIVKNGPARIFLLVGINDISHNLPTSTLAERYRNLVKKIREASPGTKLYLQSVMPVNNDFVRFKTLTGKTPQIIELNDEIKNIAGEFGAVYIDLWPVLTDAGGQKLKKEFTNDGLHLLAPGYLAWMQVIEEVLANEQKNALK